MKNAEGEPFTFEIVLSSGATEEQSIIDIYVEALKRMGIEPQVTAIDPAQYKEREGNFDFDMTYFRRGLSLSPGNEQKLYWGAAAADTPGSMNWMGVQSPAVDAMIDTILTSESREDFTAATRALDRVLTAGRYVIPIYQWRESRIAHVKELHFPDRIPIYGDFINFHPDVWWWEDDG